MFLLPVDRVCEPVEALTESGEEGLAGVGEEERVANTPKELHAQVSLEPFHLLALPLHLRAWVLLLISANLVTPFFFLGHVEAQAVLAAGALGMVLMTALTALLASAESSVRDTSPGCRSWPSCGVSSPRSPRPMPSDLAPSGHHARRDLSRLRRGRCRPFPAW